MNVDQGFSATDCKVYKVPELPFLHLDLRHLVVEHPRPEQSELAFSV
jgi:hypothetical protein